MEAAGFFNDLTILGFKDLLAPQAPAFCTETWQKINLKKQQRHRQNLLYSFAMNETIKLMQANAQDNLSRIPISYVDFVNTPNKRAPDLRDSFM